MFRSDTSPVFLSHIRWQGIQRFEDNGFFGDSYYRYQPRVQSALGYSYTLDRYGHMTQTSEVRTVNSRLAYLSDPGYPQTIADAAPYYFAKFEQQLAPEQGKYSTILDLIPADPTQLDELSEYVPTLRRSLRLSLAARCAPVFGSDYVNDDQTEVHRAYPSYSG
jgi:hypothetical protein